MKGYLSSRGIAPLFSLEFPLHVLPLYHLLNLTFICIIDAFMYDSVFLFLKTDKALGQTGIYRI